MGCSSVKQTLLTGFGPFGEVVSNPSERLLHEFLGGTLHDQEITTALFPTQYAGTAERLKALFEVGGREGVPFENVLMLGVATGRGVWSVERYAHNRIEAKQDASGFTPQASQIVHGQPETLATRADIERLVMRLEASSIPAAPSDSAGSIQWKARGPT